MWEGAGEKAGCELSACEPGASLDSDLGRCYFKAWKAVLSYPVLPFACKINLDFSKPILCT